MTIQVTVCTDDGNELSPGAVDQPREVVVAEVVEALKAPGGVLVLNALGDAILVPVRTIRYVHIEEGPS